MAVVDHLIERSIGIRGREERQPAARLGALIVACVDPRADPANIFELKRGEAAVLRVPGGRITPATLQSLGVLSAVAAADQRGRAELILMHHTDCGLSHLGPEHAALLADYFGIDTSQLLSRYPADPHASIAVDLRLLSQDERMPRQMLASGLVYDVATRVVRLAVPPATLAEHAHHPVG